MSVKTKTRSIEENIDFLRKILTVDTLLDEINQEEAVEFLDAVESNISDLTSAHEAELSELNEKLDEPTWSHLVQKVKEGITVLEDEEDNRAKELLEIVKEHDEDIVYDVVRGEGFFYVKINSMVDEEKLRNFIEREIYPSYNEQQAHIL